MYQNTVSKHRMLNSEVNRPSTLKKVNLMLVFNDPSI